MSTQERDIVGAGIAGLANITEGTSLEAEKSLVRYLWNPFKDIKIVGSEGLWIRLGKDRSFYGQGKPGETLVEYEARGGDRLLRCQAYPCWNIQYEETLTNLGKFTPQEAAAGNALGSQARYETVTIQAGVCAADMVTLYSESYGLRSLTPLIGMEDLLLAGELMNLVQPKAWKLTNLAQEEQGRLEDEQTLVFDLAERGPAYERIQGANLDATLKAKAMELLRVMRAGVHRAAITARSDFAELKKQQANAALGKPGFKAMPSLYDEHVCFLLGEAVPSAVARPTAGSDPELSAAVKLLTQYVVSGGAPISDNAAEVAEMKSILSQMRGERTRLEKLKKELEEKGVSPE